ncbi:hypothetical protein F4780DRAFT_137479 [Xylariomycetidae sp. FL0641]|nr:hypothetical protein F4780DRAFT_137479 [Xylariomycetidae sp. FL0641]
MVPSSFKVDQVATESSKFKQARRHWVRMAQVIARDAARNLSHDACTLRISYAALLFMRQDSVLVPGGWKNLACASEVALPTNRNRSIPACQKQLENSIPFLSRVLVAPDANTGIWWWGTALKLDGPEPLGQLPRWPPFGLQSQDLTPASIVLTASDNVRLGLEDPSGKAQNFQKKLLDQIPMGSSPSPRQRGRKSYFPCASSGISNIRRDPARRV